MRQSVRDIFPSFSESFEGAVPWLYSDIKGLVTIAIGNLVDPVSAALTLPLRRPDGSPATRAEIAAEWARVKNDPKCATLGYRYAETITTLRLTDDGVAEVVGAKLRELDAAMRRRFPAFETWPAEAQLATLSMCWACGPAFAFPVLASALARRDFSAAARNCHIDDAHNPGVTPRNRADVALYTNADVVERHGLDPDIITWPRTVTLGGDGAVVYALPDPPDPPPDDEA